jgi:predicted ATPase/DNA-binding SARP family transcriptional activator
MGLTGGSFEVFMSPSSKDQLHVYLFGAFRIEAKAQLIHLPTRKIESLLAYLILHSGAHSREKLAAMFWGDSPDASARGSLRKALALLRKHINEGIVLSDRENIQLNPKFPMWVDVIEFQQQAADFLADSSIHVNLNQWGLYQNDLLSDVYDDWVLPLREQYRSLYLDVLLRVVERYRAESEYKLAIEHAQKVLGIDQTNERAHQHLMFCYLTLGDRNKALQQYEACERILQDELAVEPTRETQALYRWIKQAGSEASSLAARLTNLPIPISSFVGRHKELAKVKQLLSNSRLVTLTGAGGSGKTRLAIHVATDLLDEFKNGVWWVELAPLTNPSLVPSAVAKALGVETRAEQSLMETLKRFLHNKQALLILDNCEHLIVACAQLAESLLLSCAELKILATSRETLDLFGEVIWQVPTLSLPEVQSITLMDLLMQYEGIRLFVERSTAVNPDFIPSDENAIAITQICQRLDGIPLAIELAAARTKTMSIMEISERLDDRFQLLTVGNRTVQTRHQTLRATVDWSYDLLTEEERFLFCRLSIFSGGWTLDAAEAVCSGEGFDEKAIPDLMARLVDKSLVIIRAGDQRYGMLETIRQYGNEKLTLAGEQDWLFRQYIDYYLKMAEMGDEKIRGPEQITWQKWFKSEQDNLASAMEKAFGIPTTLEQGCRLVCAMCWQWGMTGNFVVMKHWLEIAVQHSADLGRIPVRAKVLFNAGSFSVLGLNWLDPQDAKKLIEESLEIWQGTDSDWILERAKCLMILGYIQKRQFDDDKGFDLLQESIEFFQNSGDVWWHAWALNLFVTIIASSESNAVRRTVEEEISLWKETGDRWGEANPLLDLGGEALKREDYLEAEKYLLESLHIFEEFGAKGYIIQALQKLGDATRGLGQYNRARAYYEDGIPLASEIMWGFSLSQIYLGLGYVALFDDDVVKAENYFYRALKVCQKYELDRRRILCVAGFASVASVREEAITAARLFGAFYTQVENLKSEMNVFQELLTPVDQKEIDTYLSHCKAQMEPVVFEDVWNEGTLMSLDDVINELSRQKG